MTTPERKRQSLSMDLDSLFPGETIEIGNSSIIIRPLSIEQIALISKKITGLGNILSEQGITWENYEEIENMFKIASVILENFPDVLEEASNVNIEDLKMLPIEPIVQIVDKIIEVNLKSKEGLEKNFKSLISKFPQEEVEKKMKKNLRKIKK